MIRFAFCLILAFALYNNFNVAAQDTTNTMRKNLIYVEAGGVAGYMSLNYERILFLRDKSAISAKIGYSTYHLTDGNKKFNPDIILPVGVNYLFIHKPGFIIGAGQMYTGILKFNRESLSFQRENNFHTFFSAGITNMFFNDRLLLRITYTPVLENNQKYMHFLGVSIGYSF